MLHENFKESCTPRPLSLFRSSLLSPQSLRILVPSPHELHHRLLRPRPLVRVHRLPVRRHVEQGGEAGDGEDGGKGPLGGAVDLPTSTSKE